MTDENVRLGQLNNDTTYYDREGKGICASHVTEQITVNLRIQNHVPTTFIPHVCMHAFSGLPLDAVNICLVASIAVLVHSTVVCMICCQAGSSITAHVDCSMMIDVTHHTCDIEHHSYCEHNCYCQCLCYSQLHTLF